MSKICPLFTMTGRAFNECRGEDCQWWINQDTTGFMISGEGKIENCAIVLMAMGRIGTGRVLVTREEEKVLVEEQEAYWDQIEKEQKGESNAH